MELTHAPVSPEDKYIEIIFATLKSCANNRIYGTAEFVTSVRVLDSLMEQYKDNYFENEMKAIDGWKSIEENKIGVDKKGFNDEYYHRWFTALAKLIQRSGFTPPVVMDAVITTDDMGGSNGNSIPAKD